MRASSGRAGSNAHSSTTVAAATAAAAKPAALHERELEAHGRSGLHAWIPVRDEAFAVRHLLGAGYAVPPGERFHLRMRAAVRMTTALLPREEAPPPASALAEAATGRSLIS